MKKIQLGIPFRETDIEAISRNSLPNLSVEELGILFRGANIGANSRNTVPNHSAEEKATRDKTWQRQSLDSIPIESSRRARKIWFSPPKSLYYSMLTNKL